MNPSNLLYTCESIIFGADIFDIGLFKNMAYEWVTNAKLSIIDGYSDNTKKGLWRRVLRIRYVGGITAYQTEDP